MLVLPAGGGGVGALGGSSTTAGSTGAASKKKENIYIFISKYKKKNLVLIHSIFSIQQHSTMQMSKPLNKTILLQRKRHQEVTFSQIGKVMMGSTCF